MTNEIKEIMEQLKQHKISIDEANKKLCNIKNAVSDSICLFRRNDTESEYIKNTDCNDFFYLYDGGTHLAEELAQFIHKDSGCDVTIIEQGGNFVVSQTHITMNLDEEQHYERLVDIMVNRSAGKRVHVVYVSSEKVETYEADENKDVTHLLYLARFGAYALKTQGCVITSVAIGKKKDYLIEKKAIAAFGASVTREFSSFAIKQVIIEANLSKDKTVELIKKETLSDSDERLIIYKDGKRLKEEIIIDDVPIKEAEVKLQGDEVYVVIGGLGGIGQQLLKKLASQGAKHLIATGRKPFGTAILAKMEELSIPADVLAYESVDATNETEMFDLFERLYQKYGRIDYIIHSAGILEDKGIAWKTRESFWRVAGVKIKSAYNILYALEEKTYRKILFFTSTSGCFGNEGQSDYAYANTVLDNLCLEAQNEGKEVSSIAWPLWDLDGMVMTKTQQDKIWNEYGMKPLPTEKGLKLVERVLYGKARNRIVLYGDDTKLKRFVEASTKLPRNAEQGVVKSVSKSDNAGNKNVTGNKSNQILNQNIFTFISEVVANATGFELQDLKDITKIKDLGLDSIMIAEINSSLESKLGEVEKTLFFEFKTLGALSEHITKSLSEKAREQFVGKNINSEEIIEESVETDKFSNIGDVKSYETVIPESYKKSDIAIVGISGVYPQADNLEEFWKNLREGKDCIETIPKERWDYHDYEDKSSNIWWKAGAKWGGFIRDVDKFDALAFNIAPNDAVMMDPHQRIYAQTVWHALDDAGYSKERLSNYQVGVYTGAMWNNYQLYGIEDAYRGKMTCYDSSMSSVSNRISYLFDLHGPSMTLDTMCSSSLVAIHLACEALWKDEIQMAVAGGVNLTLHPYKYIQLTKGHFLSKDGRCRAFGEGGSGYVPGEGAGAVILKRLSDAKRDHDHIYGILKGSSVNHCGKGIGYSVPDPIQQGKVIKEALKNADVDPSTISYIEAHGTGTAVGDPIEIAGLHNAFAENECNMHCSVGSVKSNIGHLEAAAGMASLTKVLLQMEHHELVPSIHTKKLNPSMKLENTSFTIQRTLDVWESSDSLLRAGISAFGAGGTNAHLIIEEYKEANASNDLSTIKKDDRNLYILSANDKETLKVYAKNLAGFLKETNDTRNSQGMRQIAYTLQVCRNHMKERVAFWCTSAAQLIEKLFSFSSDVEDMDVFYAHVKRAKLGTSTYKLEESTSIEPRRMRELAQAWVNGATVNWDALYMQESIVPAKLPEYPFEKVKFWLPQGESLIYKEGNAFCENRDLEQDAARFTMFQPVWEEKEETNERSFEEFSKKNILIMVSADDYEAYQSLYREVENVRIAIMGNYKSKTENCIWVLREDYETVTNWLDETCFIPDAVIDLLDGDDFGKTEIVYGRIHFLQSLLRISTQTNLQYLHVTYENHSGQSMNGILYSSFIKNLSGEYARFNGKNVDFDKSTDSVTRIECIRKECQTAFHDNIRYYEDKRYVLSFQSEMKWERNENADIFHGKTYVITGGTRGIGARIARYLSENGVKNLALMGQSSMETPQKQELLTELSNNGSHVLTFTQGLKDESKIKAFLDDVYQTYGAIDYVIHCAGCYSDENLAFVSKQSYEFEKVFTPKVNGICSILTALQDYNVEKVLLFSSVSGVSPVLSKGLSDYAAANAFLYLGLPYMEQAYGKKLVSVIWPNWGNAGFQVKESDVYKNLGLYSISENQGIKLVQSLLEQDLHGVYMPLYHGEEFSIQQLLNALPEIPKKKVKEIDTTKESCHGDTENAEKILKSVISEVLGIPLEKIEDDESLDNYGMDSIYLGDIIKKLEKQCKNTIDPTLFLEGNTIKELSVLLAPSISCVKKKQTDSIRNQIEIMDPIKEPLEKPNKIAIVGMSGKFAGADSIEELWNNLVHETCNIVEIPESRFNIDTFYSPVQKKGKTVGKWAGLMDRIDLFDPEYFGIKKEESVYLDPLIRMTLEEGLGAVLNAGYTKKEVKGKEIGIFIGARSGEFSHMFPRGEYGKISNIGQNFIAAHLSQYFDLTGPAMVIDTACSSALVSLNEACKSIFAGECEAALVGGVDAIYNEKTFLMLSEALSPDGECRAFDEKANGFVPGEGCGMILIKEFNQALEDGDQILAVIDSIAVNNDGKTMGITTPNMKAQMDVIRKALKKANVSPEEISYIEAHGTGTLIGDPIELKSLTSVYKEYTDNVHYCKIGSVKPSIGHTLSAAGIASLIKVVLCMQNKMIPKTLHCNTPNPRFNFKASPFYPATETRSWDGINGKYRAGISSFGFGGTNAHVILTGYYERSKCKRESLPKPEFHKESYWPKQVITKEESMAEKNEKITDITYSGFGFKRMTDN